MDELVERVAIKIAVVNLFSGGNWVAHYTEDQKEQWRQRAKEVIAMVKEVSNEKEQ